MPELPDVETFRRYLGKTALHRRIERVQVESPSVLADISPQALGRRLKHRRFESTFRHGKYLFAELDEGGCLVLHFGMTGHLEYSKRPGPPPDYTVMSIFFEDGSRLAYIAPRKLGHIALVDSARDFIEQHELGTDALEIELDEFVRLAKTHRGAVKSFLMDQTVLAGVGNVYSDEILFQAKVHPAQKIDALDRTALTRLHSELKRVLTAAIEAKADPEAMPSSFLLPHRERDAHCPRCGTQLKQQRFGGRTAYVCPHCQPKPS